MIEGKQEHPRGLFNHGLAQRLALSRIAILVSMQPCWPGRKLKPFCALVALVEKMVTLTQLPHHVIADSAFCASKALKDIAALRNSVATISINRATNSGMADLYSVISQDLPYNKVIFFSTLQKKF
jgi:hypothetical protein